MSPDPSPPRGEIAEAVVETSRRPSIVWLIPVIALAVGAFVAWKAFSSRGPEITITLASADGLEAGKTKVKFKDVEIGLLESVTLDESLTKVVAHARMSRDAAPLLTEKTRFWVQKARVAGGQVTGLGTLFSGAYIAIDPVRDARSARHFEALPEAPVVTTDEAGKHFTLHSYRAGAVPVGTPVYFRRIEVGRVLSSALDPSGDFVVIEIFVAAPHDARVLATTRFWNASGFDMRVGADGLRVDTESVLSILVGGIAFDTNGAGPGPEAADGTVFPLYENRDATEREIYTQKFPYLLYFDQSVRGLHPGAPVELLGIQIGQVRDVKLEVDPEQKAFRIPVLIEIEPERVSNLTNLSSDRRARLDRLVADGLRAQLKSGNLVTGQLLVALEMQKDPQPAQIDWSAPVPILPTVPTPIEEITQSLTELAKRLGKVPVDQIGEDLRRTLVDTQSALREAQKTLAASRSVVGADSTLQVEMRRTLVELGEAARSLGLAAEQIETEPESVLFGKEKK
jgi:paraquat-inducible protein B